MNIGSLFKVKKYFWFLFPTKETALDAVLALEHPLDALATENHADVLRLAVYWSNRFNCDVSYFSPDSYIVFLEEDGELKRVLTADGKIGWIWFSKNYNNYFEEVKTES